MEKYAVTLDLARKLKEADFPQDTYWFIRHQKPTGLTKLYWKGDMDYDNERFSGDKLEQVRFREENEFFSAPLSDELLEQLPHVGNIDHLGGTERLSIVMTAHGSEVFYHDAGDRSSWPDRSLLEHAKLADSLAELWIWCKENGCISNE